MHEHMHGRTQEYTYTRTHARVCTRTHSCTKHECVDSLTPHLINMHVRQVLRDTEVLHAAEVSHLESELQDKTIELFVERLKVLPPPTPSSFPRIDCHFMVVACNMSCTSL